jgi:hypothetical protein
MANAFDQACRVESESRRIIEPLLDLHSNGRYVYTDKGRLAKEFQRKYGDALINMSGRGEMLSIEMKAERKRSENLFLEFWSNGSRFTFGWMAYSEADLLFYHFIDSDELYIADMQNLKRWFWFGIGPKRRSGSSVAHRPAYLRFEAKKQRTYDQKNDTWGCCAPISVIDKEVRLKKVNPMGLFGMESAA